MCFGVLSGRLKGCSTNPAVVTWASGCAAALWPAEGVLTSSDDRQAGIYWGSDTYCCFKMDFIELKTSLMEQLDYFTRFDINT